tara:strand:- start:3475 stop:3810 length:336 start_codon:yes stop_codon:yes gene_type:complete
MWVLPSDDIRGVSETPSVDKLTANGFRAVLTRSRDHYKPSIYPDFINVSGYVIAHEEAINDSDQDVLFVSQAFFNMLKGDGHKLNHSGAIDILVTYAPDPEVATSITLWKK